MANGEMQLILIPCLHSSAAADFMIPITENLDMLYVCCASPPITPVMLAVHRMVPERRGIITRAACLTPATMPRTLTDITRSNAAMSRSTMLNGVRHAMPALLYMMSSWPCLDTVKSTAAEMSDSSETSQATKAAFPPSSAAVSLPSFSCMSAITTLAPLSMNFAAVSFPIPPAAPVINATLPSSFLPPLTTTKTIHMCHITINGVMKIFSCRKYTPLCGTREFPVEEMNKEGS